MRSWMGMNCRSTTLVLAQCDLYHRKLWIERVECVFRVSRTISQKWSFLLRRYNMSDRPCRNSLLEWQNNNLGSFDHIWFSQFWSSSMHDDFIWGRCRFMNLRSYLPPLASGSTNCWFSAHGKSSNPTAPVDSNTLFDKPICYDVFTMWFTPSKEQDVWLDTSHICLSSDHWSFHRQLTKMTCLVIFHSMQQLARV